MIEVMPPPNAAVLDMLGRTSITAGSRVVPQLILLMQYIFLNPFGSSVGHGLLSLEEVPGTPGTDCSRVETQPCGGDGMREHLHGI